MQHNVRLRAREASFFDVSFRKYPKMRAGFGNFRDEHET